MSWTATGCPVIMLSAVPRSFSIRPGVRRRHRYVVPQRETGARPYKTLRPVTVSASQPYLTLWRALRKPDAPQPRFLRRAGDRLRKPVGKQTAGMSEALDWGDPSLTSNLPLHRPGHLSGARWFRVLLTVVSMSGVRRYPAHLAPIPSVLGNPSLISFTVTGAGPDHPALIPKAGGGTPWLGTCRLELNGIADGRSPVAARLALRIAGRPADR